MKLARFTKRHLSRSIDAIRYRKPIDLMSVVTKIGNNWFSDDGLSKEIVFLYGFDKWEQQTISSFLPQFRTAFIGKNIPFIRLARSIYQAQNAPVYTRIYKRGDYMDSVAKKYNFKLVRVEDGFVRSVGLRLDHTLPLSIIFDASGGIYFDASKPSELENLLNNHEFQDELIEEAKAGMKQFIESGTSRYNLGVKQTKQKLYGPKQQKRVLVAGQADGHKYVTFSGARKGITNNDLVKLARQENPDAQIIYKIHPEVVAGHRRLRSNPADVNHLCTVIWDDLSVDDALDAVDQVYTVSSLMGMEAIVRGIKVTCLGHPFYAGWGLTDDRVEMRRRKRRLSKEQLFAATYLLYPTYMESSYKYRVSLPNSIDLIHANFEKLENDLENSSYLSHYLPMILIKLIETNAYDEVGRRLEPFINLFDNKERVSGMMAIAIAKYCLHLSRTDEYNLSKAIEVLDKINMDSILRHKILLNVRIHLCIQCREFDKIEELCKNAVYYYINNSMFKEITIGVISDVSQVLQILHCTDQALFSFGRFSIKDVEVDYLDTYISKIFSLYWKQSNYLRKEIDNLSTRYTLFTIHQDKMNGIEVISEFMKKGNVNRRQTRINCTILQNNSITRERQMQKRLEITKKYSVLPKTKGLVRRSLVGMPVSWLIEAIEVSKNIQSTKMYIKYTNALVKKMSKNSSNLKLSDTKILIGRLIDLYKNSPKPDKTHLKEALHQCMRWHDDRPNDLGVLKLLCRTSFLLNERRLFLESYEKMPSIEGDYRFAMDCSDYFMRLERYDLAIESAEIALAEVERFAFVHVENPNLFLLYRQYRDNLNRKRFYSESWNILRNYPQPKDPKGVVFVTPYDHQNTMAMCIPVLCELRSRGYATVYLGQGVLPFEPTGNADIDKFHGIVGHSYDYLEEEFSSNKRFFNRWNLSWHNKRLTSGGVNYYQGVFEYLANRYRRFRIDIENPIIGRFFEVQHRKVDRALEVCERIHSDLASKGVLVNILGVSGQTSPAYTFKEYCAHKGKGAGMRFYFALNGYENYYSNLGTKNAGTLAIADMTSNYDRRSPLIAELSAFREWMRNGNDISQYKKEVDVWLNKNRVNKQSTSPEASAVWEKITKYKESGKKIIVVYGKVLCDLGVPYDGGPAHKDMYDWINHTVSASFGGSALILIKPHPHEKRPEIARHLTEYLFDLIEVDVPENVVLMDNSWFNNNEITQVMDLGVLWNGTSCLELGAAGIPVVMCAYHGRFDYPIEFYYPKSRTDYEKILSGKKNIKPEKHVDVECQLLLKYMSTEELAVKYKYALRTATNDPVLAPYWFDEDLEEFYSNGDVKVSKLADRFFQYD